MRKEIENWWLQAKEDFDSSKINFNAKKYYVSVFLCQQAVEKGLKAFILNKEKIMSFEGHSLIYLGKTAKVPESFFPGLKKLSPHYLLTRYPDISEDVPYEIYDKTQAEEFLKFTEEVLTWIKKHLA